MQFGLIFNRCEWFNFSLNIMAYVCKKKLKTSKVAKIYPSAISD